MPCSMARPAKVDQIRKRLVVFANIGQVVHVSGPTAMATLAPIAAAPCDGVPLHLPFLAAQVRVVFGGPLGEEAPVRKHAGQRRVSPGRSTISVSGRSCVVCRCEAA
jgi:hypothetical protein